MKLNALQKGMISLAKEEGEISPKSIAKKYDECYKTIRENLIELEQKHLIQRTDNRRLKFRI